MANARLLCTFKGRDVKTAEHVGRKAELGWIDVEFIMYGCAYFDTKIDKICYRVSSKEEDIYNFIEKSVQYGCYPSVVMHLTKRYPLPAGTKEMVATEVKRELARQLKVAYPREFFCELHQMAELHTTNHASAALWDNAERLEGVFDEVELQKFEEQLLYCYSRCALTEEQYSLLQRWLYEERKNMKDNASGGDAFAKTVYGYLYEMNGKVKYFVDARRSNVYRNICMRETAGAFVSPIYSKIYWCNRDVSNAEIVLRFKQEMDALIYSGEIEKLKKIVPSADLAQQEFFRNKIETVRASYGDLPAETLQRYGYHWGVLR